MPDSGLILVLSPAGLALIVAAVVHEVRRRRKAREGNTNGSDDAT
jgi:hypothetical protein